MNFQVTGLAALKLLGVTAGALLARRGKREEPTNQVDYNYNIYFRLMWNTAFNIEGSIGQISLHLSKFI